MADDSLVSCGPRPLAFTWGSIWHVNFQQDTDVHAKPQRIGSSAACPDGDGAPREIHTIQFVPSCIASTGALLYECRGRSDAKHAEGAKKFEPSRRQAVNCTDGICVEPPRFSFRFPIGSPVVLNPDALPLGARGQGWSWQGAPQW